MVYFFFALIIIVADQAMKLFTVANLSAGGEISLIDGIIHLTYMENRGAAFSILSDQTLMLTIVSAVASIAIILAILFMDMGWLGRLSLAGVLGGAVGNLIDRIRLGYVVDMFEPEFIDFAIFNIADIFITVGGIVFVIHYIVYAFIKAPKKPAAEKAAAGMAEEYEEIPVKKAPKTARTPAEELVFEKEERDEDIKEALELTKDIPVIDEEMSFTLEDILREAHNDD